MKTHIVAISLILGLVGALIIAFAFGYSLGKQATEIYAFRELQTWQQQAVAMGLGEWQYPETNWNNAHGFRWKAKP